jgi:hypothetical protein
MAQDPAFLDKVARIKADSTKPGKKPTAEGQMTSPGGPPAIDGPIDHTAAHRVPVHGCNPPSNHAGWWVDGICSTCGLAPDEPR